MTNRREFVQTSVTLSALPLFGGKAAAETAGAVPPLALGWFVYDARFPAAVRIATAGKAAPLRPIEGDVSDLWYHELDLALRETPRALAGVTTAESLFVLERLGWDRGLKIAYRGVHAEAADGRVAHELTAAPALLKSAAATGGDWTAMVAHLTRHDGGKARLATVALATPDGGARGGGRPALHSWVLVPRRRTA